MLAMGPGGLLAVQSGEHISNWASTSRNRGALAAGNGGATLAVVGSYQAGGEITPARPAYAGLAAASVPRVVVEQVVVRDVDGALIGRMRVEAGAVVAGRVSPIDEGRAAW